jgi:hypothetical protein
MSYLLNVTRGESDCNPAFVHRQQFDGKPSQFLQLRRWDIAPVIFRKREYEYSSIARTKRYQCPIAAGAALTFTPDTLFDDTATKIGIDETLLGANDRFDQQCVGDIRLSGEAGHPSGLEYAHDRPRL